MPQLAPLALLALLGLGCDDMGLPTTREITAAPNTDIPSAVLNVVQDCIVGGKHPEFEFAIHIASFQSVGANAAIWNGNYSAPGAGGSVWAAAIPVRVGQRITRLRIKYKRSTGGGDATVSLFQDTAAGAGSTVATHVDATHDGADVIYELAVNYAALTECSYWISFAIGDNTGPGRFYSCAWFADRL